jgi:hypothetical protein
MRRVTLLPTILAASLVASPAPATVGIHLDTIFGECRSRLGLGDVECSCVNDRVAASFPPLEIEYIAVRISEDMVEVERLRKVLLFGRRLSMLVEVSRIIEDCAAGAPFNNPL